MSESPRPENGDLFILFGLKEAMEDIEQRNYGSARQRLQLVLAFLETKERPRV